MISFWGGSGSEQYTAPAKALQQTRKTDRITSVTSPLAPLSQSGLPSSPEDDTAVRLAEALAALADLRKREEKLENENAHLRLRVQEFHSAAVHIDLNENDDDDDDDVTA